LSYSMRLEICDYIKHKITALSTSFHAKWLGTFCHSISCSYSSFREDFNIFCFGKKLTSIYYHHIFHRNNSFYYFTVGLITCARS
jgi:hypothetical protein